MGQGCLFIIAIGWALLFLLPTLGALKGLGFGYFILFLLIGGTPISLLIWYGINKTAKQKEAHAAMLRAVGFEASKGYDHTEAGTSIVINRSAKTITLMVSGFWKTYQFSDIREWECRSEKAGRIVGGHAIVTATANLQAASEALANSGLFITVKDIEHPKWRISMVNSQTQSRWMEILRQELNEN